MSTPAVLDRVRKLLALATSPNVHEAASAAAAAQTLIERHRLDGLLAAHAAAEVAITDGREAPLERARRLRRWKVALAAGLAEANGCVAYTAEDRATGEALLLVLGQAEDRAAIAAVWEWLVVRLEWLSASEGPGQSRGWHEAFRVGAADVVVARLFAAGKVEAGMEVGMEAGNVPAEALVRVSAARAAEVAAVLAFAEQRLGRGRGLRVDARAYAAGRAAGARLNLLG